MWIELLLRIKLFKKMLFYKVFGDYKYFNICLFGEMIVLYDFINDFIGLVNMDYSGCC